MDTYAERTVGELVAEDYRRAGVFKRYGIDFCCGGGAVLGAVCAKKGIEVEVLVEALQAAEQHGETVPENPMRWPLEELVEYIVQVHHTYVRDNVPVLKEFLQKVARVHGEANPETVEIARRFEALAEELESHMAKEELVLFPYVRQAAGAPAADAALTSVEAPLRVMEAEHDQAGVLMEEIRRLSNDYTPPEHACMTYRVAYFKLAEFEEDLHRHIHLENNILFPRVRALRETGRAATA